MTGRDCFEGIQLWCRWRVPHSCM